MLLETLDRNWSQRGRFRAFERAMTINDDGLVLGAGTILAEMGVDLYGRPALMIEGNEERILTLLSLAYGRPVPPWVIGKIRNASGSWGKGEKALAAIHLAQAALEKLEAPEAASYLLFLAAGLMDAGIEPAQLLKGLGVGIESYDAWAKYNHNHDEEGRFASAPGGPSARRKPWDYYPHPELRQKLAEMESSAGHAHDGYREQNETTNALGRYQMLPGALVDAGWKNRDGTWTQKARDAGVFSDADFLNNPEAQEQAETDVIRRNIEQLQANGAWSRIGSVITDSKRNTITVTAAGLLSAAQKEGAGAVHNYFRQIDKGGGNRGSENFFNRDKNIEGRLFTAMSTPF